MKKQLAVGDTVWLVWNDRRRGDPQEHVVSKVGRKWIYIYEGLYRFDAETWMLDNGGYLSAATIYESKEAWEKEVSLENAWRRFAENVRNQYGTVPSGATEEAIEQAAKLPGIWSEKND